MFYWCPTRGKPFPFFICYVEYQLNTKGFDGVDTLYFKMLMLLYADDIVITADSAENLQRGLNILREYDN